MKKFRLYMFVAVLLVLISNGSTPAQQTSQKTGQPLTATSASKGKTSLEEAITSMENRAWAAVKSRDRKAFSNLFAADGLMADSEGIATLADFLQTLPDLMITEYTLTNVKVMMIDKDSAIITYKADVKGSFKGQAFPPNPLYVSSVWTKRGGKWLAVYHQETMAR